MKRPRAKYHDLSKLIIGARLDKPSPLGRKVQPVKVTTKEKYRGQCPACGGARVVQSPVAGITHLCPLCTGYRTCGL